MAPSIKQWFIAPLFAGDEEKTRRASLLNATLLAGFLLMIFVVITNLLDPNTPPRNYLIDLAVLVCLVLFRWLLGRGHILAVSLCVVIAGFAMMAVVIINEASILVPATSALILFVVISGILFNSRGIIIATLASSLMIGAIGHAQLSGWLPHIEVHLTFSHWLVFTILFGITGGLTYFFYRTLQRALQKANREIAERERIQLELRKLTRAVEQSPVSIVITDTSGAIEYVNPRFTQLTGYSAAEAIGQNPRILKTDQTPPGTHRQMWDRLTAGQEWRGEFVNLKKNGETFIEQATISPITNSQGLVTHYLAVKEDITARKLAEAQLQQAHDELEQRVQERTAELHEANQALQKASRIKDEFLSMMSHELRTPLTGILGLSQLLQFPSYGTLNEKQRSAVTNIEKSGQRLNKLVSTILEYAGLLSGKNSLQRRPCSLVNICRASFTRLQGRAQEHGLKISIQTPDELSAEVDDQRLAQMLDMLLDNAVKFSTPGGSIHLDLSASPQTRQAFISVRDDGIGIAEKDQERLFQPFTQLDTRLARDYDGAGMSLALVKLLAELHGGSVTVTSAPGEGSVFTLVLPWDGEIGANA